MWLKCRSIFIKRRYKVNVSFYEMRHSWLRENFTTGSHTLASHCETLYILFSKWIYICCIIKIKKQPAIFGPAKNSLLRNDICAPVCHYKGYFKRRRFVECSGCSFLYSQMQKLPCWKKKSSIKVRFSQNNGNGFNFMLLLIFWEFDSHWFW